MKIRFCENENLNNRIRVSSLQPQNWVGTEVMSLYMRLKAFALSGILSHHYNDVIMGAMASQITSLTIVYLILYSGVD